MFILFKITKATSKHVEYIKRTVFLRQPPLLERTTKLRVYVYYCLVTVYKCYLAAVILSYLAVT